MQKNLITAQSKRFFSPTVLILAGIFLLALVLRLFHLGMTPVGFHVDEVNAGYVGRYVLESKGRDIFGNWLPLFFNKFGDYRPIGIFYLSGIATYLLGATEFAVRFPSALIGALTVIPLYLLGLAVSGSEKVGYAASLFLALLPWHIVLSRATSESVIGLFLVCFGLWLLLRAVETARVRLILYGAACLLGSYFFYHTFRAIVPLLVLPFAVMSVQKSIRTHMRLLVVFFFTVTIVVSLTPFGSGRLSQVAFYKNPDLVTKIGVQLSGDSGVPLTVTRMFHNKPAVYVREFINQYISYYSMPYLFYTGGFPDRYRVPDQGLLYFVFAPLLLLGLVTALIEKKYRSKWAFIIYALIIASLPASITYEDAPNVQRSLPMVIPLLLLAGYGVHIAWEYLSKYKLLLVSIAFVFSAILLYETSSFVHQYAVHADAHRSLYRNDGNRELFARIKERYASVDYIVMPLDGELPMYAGFYLSIFNFFPSSVYEGATPEARLGKFIFVSNTCPGSLYTQRPEGIGMYIDYAGCPGAPGLIEQKVIQRTDLSAAYRVYTTDK